MAEYTWYRKGLRFSCVQCGACCSGDPGYVWVTKEERRRIARALGLKSDHLPRKYARRVGFRHSLTERANGDCIFLKRRADGVGCMIYDQRPVQCRTWPFWRINLKSPEHWAAAASMCPGMNQGKLHPPDQIEERLGQTW